MIEEVFVIWSFLRTQSKSSDTGLFWTRPAKGNVA